MAYKDPTSLYDMAYEDAVYLFVHHVAQGPGVSVRWSLCDMAHKDAGSLYDVMYEVHVCVQHGVQGRCVLAQHCILGRSVLVRHVV